MKNHGTRFDLRFQVMGERVMAMKALWTQDEAEFHGTFEDFDPVWSYPETGTATACANIGGR